VTEINSKQITELFGLGSEIYSKTAKFLKKQEQLKKIEFQKKYRLWESVFKNVYGKEIDSELFLKHSYFASILKILIIVKADNLEEENLIENYNLPELEFFFCPDLERDFINEVHNLLENSLLTKYITY